MKRYWNGKQTVAAFVAAAFCLFSTLAAFGANDKTSRSSTSPVEPFESTAKIDPQTTVFLYLADCADENLRRIYVEYNKAIRAAFVESAGADAFERFLKEEEEREAAKLIEIKEAAALEHDAAFRKIEAESKTPDEKAERVERFYEDLGVRRPGTTPKEWAAARERSIELESNRYLLRLWPLRPRERARLRVAQETWRLIESKIWPELSVDWENLNLDGARFDFRPEVLYDLDAPGRGFEKFGGWRWGIPATLEELSRSKSWRDKTLRGADFYRVFADASFAGWTLENCRFWADESGQGTAFDVASKAPGVGAETRRPGELWQGAATENAESEGNANGGANVGYVGCDFADATLKNVLFDGSATITFAQFAATRSFKEDEIDAEFRFPLDGWDFAGKNVDALRTETPVAAEVASDETADDAASFAAEKTAGDESERVVYLYLKKAQSEKAQGIWNAWSEKVRAAKAENAVRLDALFFYERERSPEAPVKATWSSEYCGILERTWARVFDGTVETLETAKIDVDWENLNLDGATISEAPRRCVNVSAEEEPEPYGDVKCVLFYDDVGNVEVEYGIRATLAELRRTVNWREKRLSDANFVRACFDESFAGWTLTKCCFTALLHGGLGGCERSEEWLSRNPDGCKRADFTDATLDRCFFDDAAAITFQQFASTRSYREDKICVSFYFPPDGWDFAGKNIGDVDFGPYRNEISYLKRRAKLDGARFEPTSKVYPALPEAVWRNSRACKEKDLAGATFYSTLGGGDFSGFDLTGATMRGVRVKSLDGATIRGLRVVAGTNYGNSERERIEFRRQREYGKITKEAICATKSWRDKDLRDVEFNWFYDLTGVDFSGCDLRGATFRFAKGYGNELEKAPFFEDVDFTDANIDGCKFYVFAKEDERSWPTLEQIMSTETWKSGDLERLKTCVLPDEAQKIVDRRLFEASPEFAAKDFSGKEIKFRDMSGWDLSGLNLTGCEIKTCSLWEANLSGAILDGARLRQDYAPTANATTERLHRQLFLNLEQLAETDNYRRKSFRNFALWANVRDGRFSFVGLDLTNASFAAQLGGFDKKKWASRDFTDAEIEGANMLAYMTKKQLLATKTFKEGRLDYEAVDKIRLRKERVGDELRAEYERLQAEKAKNAENAEEPAENGDDAKESTPETRTFYLYDVTTRTNESGETDWESLSLDGATLSDDPFEIFDEDVGEENGVPATLAQLRRTKTWREKTAREVVFNASLVGESFAGWTFERCEFGGRWRTSNVCPVKNCDFADATFDDVYFGAPGITFEQFAASRSFKEDKIVAEFTFPLVGWDFAGKNVANIEVPTWDGAKLDGARLETPRTTNRWAWGLIAGGLDAGPRDKAPRWAKVVPESLWRETEAFKNKDLSGTFFWPSLNGGDFSGFDLTDAFLLDGPGENFKLDGATIRGIKFRERHNVTKAPFFGAIPASAIYRTKSWKDKDLRGVCFGVYFDLKGADFAGCDLRGAVFSTPVDGADFSGADLRGAKFVWRAFYDSFEDKPLKKPEFGKKGANFSGADLRGADFRNAEGAALRSNFKGAKIDETTLGLAERLVEKERLQREKE
ncbi:MAG: pentapeptide repeat-containing protein [Thermoguttaceae bacterium]|nr:pentapeptide repeat-containing protein [Thermoguttaceae bacterium]